jgi:hypothetical protein
LFDEQRVSRSTQNTQITERSLEPTLLTYPLKKNRRSVSNSSSVTPERWIGFASDVPSAGVELTCWSPRGRENIELKMGEFSVKKYR